MGKQFIRKSLEAASYTEDNVRGVFLQVVKKYTF
jgi:hypothetical protein